MGSMYRPAGVEHEQGLAEWCPCSGTDTDWPNACGFSSKQCADPLFVSICLQVISRSGDECVVALTDQWYLTYGEDEWQV